MLRRNGLTALRVRRLRKPGRHADGGGLYLAVSDNGAKSWIFAWKKGGRRRTIGGGSAADVSLAEAREWAADCRKEVHSGREPRSARLIKSGIPSFGDCARELIEAKEPEWRNAKHRWQWEQTLTTYAALLRPLPVDQVTTEMVLRTLRPIWQTKTETASRVRQRIEAVLDWARAHDYRSGENPARWRGHLALILPSPNKIARVVHHPAMPYADVPAFMAELASVDTVTARALELAILTAVRSNEVRGATWPEINFDAAVWTLPAERMKAGKEHRVPLSSGRVMRILEQQWRVRISDDAFIFPGMKAGRPLKDGSLTELLHRLGHDVTVHGFRSSFADWCGDTTAYPRDLVEAALAHAIENKVAAAYRRSDALERRRDLMTSWSSYCSGKAKVVPIRRAQ
jgi:integrase